VGQAATTVMATAAAAPAVMEAALGRGMGLPVAALATL
jgi:hypothetical protein